MKIKGKKPTILLPPNCPFKVGDFVIAKNGSIGEVYGVGSVTCKVYWQRLDGLKGINIVPTVQLKALDKDVAEMLLEHRQYANERI